MTLVPKSVPPGDNVPNSEQKDKSIINFPSKQSLTSVLVFRNITKDNGITNFPFNQSLKPWLDL